MNSNIVNFRDLGGTPIAGGKTVRFNRILRSGELVHLNDEAKLILQKHKLKTIVDLRSADETAKAPDDHLDGVRYRNIDLLRDHRNKSSKSDVSNNGLEQMTAQENVGEMMKQVYLSLVCDTSALEGYRAFVDEHLRLEEGALIFHCYAGKDRTGVAAAIILTLLGASEDAIIEDYLLSNTLRAEANEIEFQKLRDAGANEQQIDRLRIAMNVDAAYLQGVFQYAAAQSGSFHRYIRQKLYITDAEIDRLKIYYLA